MRRLSIGSSMLAGVALLAGALAVPAEAAPPPNDAITSPTAVTTVPATFRQDTTGATASAADGRCVKGHSIWYRYRPTASTTARVVTVGSDYDTVLAVFHGPRDHRVLAACNDDGVGYASAVRLRFEAGTTYWIALSSCCSRSGSAGGNSVLTFYRNREARVTSTVDSVRSGGVSGRLIVSGTVRCNTPSYVELQVAARQRLDQVVARGFGYGEAPSCTRRDTPWVVRIDSDTDWAFRAGSPVALEMDGYLTDGFASMSFHEERTMVPTDEPAGRPGGAVR